MSDSTLLTVLRHLDVHGHEVALLDGPRDRLELGELAPQPLLPRVDLVVGDLDGGPGDLHALVVVLGELETRADLDGRREDEGLARLQLLDVDVGVADGSQILLADRRPEVARGRWSSRTLRARRRGPTCASMIGFGAFPLRNPGILISFAIAR